MSVHLFAKRSRAVVLSSFALLIAFMLSLPLLFYLTFAPQAHAEENRPEAPGSISGTVTNAAGEPLAGIHIRLWRRDPNGGHDYFQDAAVTAVDGRYRVPLLGPGLYKVEFHDPQLIYAGEFYDNVYQRAQATEIPIAGNAVTGIDALLVGSGTIAGSLRTAEGLTFTTASLYLYAPDPSGYTAWTVIRSDTIPVTQTDYSITGLMPGTYRVCASAYLGNGRGRYDSECYNNVADVNRAEDITVTIENTIANVDLVLGDGADLAAVQGQVTNLAGQPLAGIDVYLEPVPTPTPGPDGFPVPTATPSFPGQAAKQAASAISVSPGNVYPYPPFASTYVTQTNSSGTYLLPLVDPNRYYIRFLDIEGTYAAEYYQDALFFTDAQPLLLAPRDQVILEPVTLGPSAQITGVVKILDEVPPSAYVQALLSHDGDWIPMGGAGTDQLTGEYAISGLPAGVYRVLATGSTFDMYYTTYYPNSDQVEEATDLSLAVGGIRQNINFNLRSSSTYDGYITGQVQSGEELLSGVRVNLHAGCCQARPVTYTFTDAQGRYLLGGLPRGHWTVSFVDPNGVYARLFAGNVPTLEQADFVFGLYQDVAANYDAELRPGGAITGRVLDRYGNPASNLYIRTYLVADGLPQFVASDSRTNDDGTYTLQGLYPGIYRVCFDNNETPSTKQECVGRPEIPYPFYDGASDIVVVAGETTNSVNLTWGPDHMLYLPVIAR